MLWFQSILGRDAYNQVDDLNISGEDTGFLLQADSQSQNSIIRALPIKKSTYFEDNSGQPIQRLKSTKQELIKFANDKIINNDKAQ